MTDTELKYDLQKLAGRIKNMRQHRSKQYKSAQKNFNDIEQMYKDSSILSNDITLLYENTKTVLQQCEKYKPCVSQEKLAEAINVKRQTIIDWEKGKTYPSIENLVQLCSIFNCNMDYLLGSVKTPITEPVSIAHYFSGISSEIIEYGLNDGDYLNCLNFFMLPENCASIFNDVTISAWRNLLITSTLPDIKSPLKEDIIKAYDEYSAKTPIHQINKTSYRVFLEKKFPMQKLIINKLQTENGYKIKSCFQPIIYQEFLDGKHFNYSTFINYLVDHTFEQLSQNALIETQKIKLAKAFIDLFERFLES